MLQYQVGPWSSLVFMVCSLVGVSVFVAGKYWKTDDTIELTPAAFFQFLRKKDVNVINSFEVDEFELKLVDPNAVEGDNEEEHLDKVA